ncbi:hypothetical protein HGA15_13935 [Nocardia flavorosea]|uniref:Arabinosyltransferase C-terminal domain-containing protein n=1 Tax=Nocardia flavorosea TaxID=53429 RepID=A0A846YC91_9NOCA|nr:hypothetical protein [Nocardia flavorosea]
MGTGPEVQLEQLPAQADSVRIVASVDSSDPAQWMAVTPPRVPRLQFLDSLSDTPARY